MIIDLSDYGIETDLSDRNIATAVSSGSGGAVERADGTWLAWASLDQNAGIVAVASSEVTAVKCLQLKLAAMTDLMSAALAQAGVRCNKRAADENKDVVNRLLAELTGPIKKGRWS